MAVYLFYQIIYQSVFSNVSETKSMILLSFSTQQGQRKFLRTRKRKNNGSEFWRRLSPSTYKQTSVFQRSNNDQP
jgi:hypothetical protein